MRRVRNFLISTGAYWLSDYPVGLVAYVFGKLNNGVIYGYSIFSVIAMGFMESLGRSVCATLGAAIVVLSVDDEKPQRWALLVALLYVVIGRSRYHWARDYVPTTWDRVEQISNALWPAVICVIAANLFVRMRRGSLRPAA